MADGDLTLEEAARLVPPPAAATPPEPLLPNATAAANLLGATQSVVNAPPVLGDTRRRQQALGEEPGVPFHEEGLSTWTDLMAKSQANAEERVKYLARRFGANNVRINDFGDPVVRITNPDTGKPEDYPLNPRQLTLNSVTSLARFAPDIAGGLLGMMAAGPKAGVFKKALLAAIGSESGGAGREIVAGAATRPLAQVGETPVQASIVQHLENVPADVLAELGLVGLVKGGQFAAGLARGNIPNPIAGTALTTPARPEFTKAGVEASRQLQSMTGIDPNLRPSESTGIPLMAMLEQYMERKPAGAAPQIAAGEAREQASKAIQNWMVDPTTLASDEEIGRRGLAALQRTVEPFEKDVALAKFGVEAEAKGAERLAGPARAAAQAGEASRQTADILTKMRVSSIPDQGVDLSAAGDMLRGKAVAMRDEFKAKADELYNAFFDHPLAKEPVVGGEHLKEAIDALRADLPKVRKTVTEPTGVVDATGAPITREAERDIPITTPIRPRLDELSDKLTDGKVSINDLKQIRTDIDNAIKTGEAIPGVKEGRLKATYGAVTDAINAGLAEIKDPELSRLWKDATSFYRANVDKFEEKNVARLFREADQSASVGNAGFAKRAMTDPDVYGALKQFYGTTSPEMVAFRATVKNKTLSDALGAGGLVDGANLTRLLKTMKDNQPALFKDVFAGRGNDFLRAAEQLGSWQQKVPIEEIDKLLTSKTPGAPSVKLIALEAAQRRLNQEYQNEIVNKFLRGNLPAAELQPDKFVSSLPQAKLSDVREVMTRLEREAPDVAEQVRRKSVQNLLSEARRTATPTDAMAKLRGEPGDLVSGVGLHNALGSGDQLAKYQSLLGDLYEPLRLYAQQELLGEERRRVAAGVGMLAPGSAMNMLVKALTPWEGHDKGKGLVLELGGLARDKVLSIALANDSVRRWLTSPYALKEAPRAVKMAILSEPFLKGLKQEFGDTGAFAHTLAVLKSSFGTASDREVPGQGDLPDRAAVEQLVPPPKP